VIEPHRRRDKRIVDDLIADNLARCRATNDGRPFEVIAELIYKFALLYQRSSAEGENDTLPIRINRR
jgi:hypothetical protein